MDPEEGTPPAQDALPPSGRQFTLAFAGQTALVTEVGGSLRRYTVDGHDLLDGYGEEEMCTGARGQSLIPWPNRIRHGRYDWHGRSEQLDLSEPAKGGAIHGLTRWANWEVEQQAESYLSLVHTQHACQGWPWVLSCRLEYRLDATGLSVLGLQRRVLVEVVEDDVGVGVPLQRDDEPRVDAGGEVLDLGDPGHLAGLDRLGQAGRDAVDRRLVGDLGHHDLEAPVGRTLDDLGERAHLDRAAAGPGSSTPTGRGAGR